MKKVRKFKTAPLRRVARGAKKTVKIVVARGAEKRETTGVAGVKSGDENGAHDANAVINTKSIIICDDDKVKRYAELIKNSNMRPIAVVGKNNSAPAQKKLTAKTVVLCIAVGLILGFVNGFLGGGGGMLCVPLLVFALKLPDKRAHATAILIMLPISLVSFAVYACNMRIEWELALWVVLGSVAGGFIGSILLKKLSNSWLRAIFALIMIGAGIRLVV